MPPPKKRRRQQLAVDQLREQLRVPADVLPTFRPRNRAGEVARSLAFQHPTLAGILSGTGNVAKGVAMFVPDALKALSSYTPEELRDPEIQQQLRDMGRDPEQMLHEALQARGRDEPVGASEGAAALLKGIGLMGYNLQRAIQGGEALYERDENGRFKVSDTDVSPRERSQAVTEMLGNVGLLALGRRAEVAKAKAAASFPPDLPETPTFIRRGRPTPNTLQNIRTRFRQTIGGGEPLPRVDRMDVGAAKRMAKIYDELRSEPDNPQVREAYDAFNRETQAQAEALKRAGYSWEFVKDDPYPPTRGGSKAMLRDLKNKHIRVYETTGEQSHPLMTNEQNNLFRAVHEILGHGPDEVSFSAKGEEGAYRSHAQMYSPLARRVMATETRGQNSWFNFGPNADIPAPQRPFAVQKAALWPEEMLGDYPSMPLEQMAGQERINNALFNRPPGIREPFLPEGAPETLGGSALRRILRVEHPETSTGPYQSYEASRAGIPEFAYARERPVKGVPASQINEGLIGRQPTWGEGYVGEAPLGGKLVYPPPEYLYGFPDRAAYEQWFTPHERSVLQRLGYDLQEFDVDPSQVMEGPLQVAFNPEAAQHVSTQPPGLLHIFDPQRATPTIGPLTRQYGRSPGGILQPVEAGTYLRDVPQVEQSALPQPKSPIGFGERYSAAMRALESPLVLEDLQRGVDLGFHDWYNADPILKSAIDAIGPEAGPRAFARLMDLMKPTSTSASPEPNLRLAGYQFFRDANPQTPQFAQGFTPLYQRMMRAKLAELEAARGRMSALNNPKIEQYGEALKGNWAGLVGDRHFWRRMAQYGYPYNPKTSWGPVSSAFRDVMQEHAARGDLPVPEGRSPTSAGQAAVWGGGGEQTGVRNIQNIRPTFWQIFEDAAHRTAKHTGLDPADVLRMFWRQEIPLF